MITKEEISKDCKYIGKINGVYVYIKYKLLSDSNKDISPEVAIIKMWYNEKYDIYVVPKNAERRYSENTRFFKTRIKMTEDWKNMVDDYHKDLSEKQ